MAFELKALYQAFCLNDFRTSFEIIDKAIEMQSNSPFSEPDSYPYPPLQTKV